MVQNTTSPTDAIDESLNIVSDIPHYRNIVSDIPHYEYECPSSDTVQTKQTQTSQDSNKPSNSDFSKECNEISDPKSRKRSSIAATNLTGWQRSDTSVQDDPDDII